MRIIHTSDWHLGRRFGATSLAADQEELADWFVALCRDQRAELVLIAGDLYDRAIPPVGSIELFRDTVGRLLANGSQVAAITGNHDSADRAAPHGDLLDLSGFFLRGGYDHVGSVVPLDGADGPLDLVLLPYLDPKAAPDDFGGPAPEHLGDVPPAADELLERRSRRTHRSVLHDACTLAGARMRAPRSVAVAHAFVTGGEASESERQLDVGGTGEVPASLFEPFSYTALGHLHRPQAVSGSATRYSGTPLAYSFSEEHQKSVVVIDMDAEGRSEISTVAVDVGRRVRTLTGGIEDLLDPRRHPDAHDCFVRAVLTDRETVLDARSRLAAVYPHVVEIRLRPLDGGPERSCAPTDVRDLEPLDAARRFWAAAEGSPPDPEIDAVLADATARALDGGAR